MSTNHDKSGNPLPPRHVNNDGNTYDHNGKRTNKKPDYSWMNPQQQNPWQPSNTGGGNNGGGNSTGGSGCPTMIILLVSIAAI